MVAAFRACCFRNSSASFSAAFFAPSCSMSWIVQLVLQLGANPCRSPCSSVEQKCPRLHFEPRLHKFSVRALECLHIFHASNMSIWSIEMFSRTVYPTGWCAGAWEMFLCRLLFFRARNLPIGAGIGFASDHARDHDRDRDFLASGHLASESVMGSGT